MKFTFIVCDISNFDAEATTSLSLLLVLASLPLYSSTVSAIEIIAKTEAYVHMYRLHFIRVSMNTITCIIITLMSL